MSFIETKELSKQYQMGSITINALKTVNLSIEQGTFSVIMGPSGSGKSTLLQLLGGLDRPSDGEIQIDKLTLNELDENDLARFRRVTVGFIFQAFNLIESLTALENVSYPMRFSNVPKKVRNQQAMNLLEQLNIADRANHRPSELSGGQQQRVAIARALVNDPHLILADEPTGNLDTLSGGAIMEVLAELNSNGKTIMVVTHDPRFEQIAQRTMYLIDGSVVSETKYQSILQMAT